MAVCAPPCYADLVTDPTRELTEILRFRAYEGTTAAVDAVAKVERRKRADMLRLITEEGLKVYQRRQEERR